jgi:hypothetical protein
MMYHIVQDTSSSVGRATVTPMSTSTFPDDPEIAASGFPGMDAAAKIGLVSVFSSVADTCFLVRFDAAGN